MDTSTAFPDALRFWRTTKRFSQLQLAMEADVSARHISFLETGRARPSREMIAQLGDAMQLPLAARNQMLANAGFAPRYSARAWDDEAMAPIRGAVAYTLDRHAPYPALAIDRLWRVMQLNAPANALFGQLGVKEGDSLLELLLGDHLPALVENWDEVAYHAAQRLRTESAAQGGVAELDHAAENLAGNAKPKDVSPLPVLPTILRFGEKRLNLFTTLAQFGTPEDLTLDDLKIELYFPADDRTRQILEQMAGGASTPPSHSSQNPL